MRGEVRLGFLLYRSLGGGGGGGGRGAGVGKWEKKALQIPIHAWRYRYQKCTACFFLIGTGTNKCDTSTTLQKFPEFSTFWISLYSCFSHYLKPTPN